MGDNNRRFNFVTMLASRAACPGSLDLTILKQFIGWQSSWVIRKFQGFSKILTLNPTYPKAWSLLG